MSKIAIFFELLKFLKESKKWWLIPIVVTMMLLGLLLIVTEGSVLAPFIYTLF